MELSGGSVVVLKKFLYTTSYNNREDSSTTYRYTSTIVLNRVYCCVEDGRPAYARVS